MCYISDHDFNSAASYRDTKGCSCGRKGYKIHIFRDIADMYIMFNLFTYVITIWIFSVEEWNSFVFNSLRIYD